MGDRICRSSGAGIHQQHGSTNMSPLRGWNRGHDPGFEAKPCSSAFERSPASSTREEKHFSGPDVSRLATILPPLRGETVFLAHLQCANPGRPDPDVSRLATVLPAAPRPTSTHLRTKIVGLSQVDFQIFKAKVRSRRYTSHFAPGALPF
jgi:hypothetical protein